MKEVKSLKTLKDSLKKNKKVKMFNLEGLSDHVKETPKLSTIIDKKSHRSEKLRVSEHTREKVLNLSCLDNSTRKEVYKNRLPIPKSDEKTRRSLIPVDISIYTNHLGQNGRLTCDIARTITVTDTPKITFIKDKKLDIRELSAVEAERIQGYPDDYTKFGETEDGEVYVHSDRQRKKMCGNGISGPVSRAVINSLVGNQEIVAASLFSGCGGTESRLDSNIKVKYYCELEDNRRDNLRYKFKHEAAAFYKDVKETPGSAYKGTQLLLAGFPCQSWSRAGLSQGFKDLKGRGELIFDVFRILRDTNPKYVMLENVRGILDEKHRDSLIRIIEELCDIGYEVDIKLLNSKNFGVPQTRDRVFIVGRRP